MSVDDDMINQMVVENLLSTEVYQVTFETDGVAYDAVKNLSFLMWSYHSTVVLCSNHLTLVSFHTPRTLPGGSSPLWYGRPRPPEQQRGAPGRYPPRCHDA